jgi:hypothetical protein
MHILRARGGRRRYPSVCAASDAARCGANGRRDRAKDGAPRRDQARGEVAPVPPRRLRQLLRRHQRRAHAQAAGVQGRAAGARFPDGGEEDAYAFRDLFRGIGRVGVGEECAQEIPLLAIGLARREMVFVRRNEGFADLKQPAVIWSLITHLNACINSSSMCICFGLGVNSLQGREKKMYQWMKQTWQVP